MARRGPRRHLIGALWGVGVAAEVVLFAVSGRLPPSLRPTALLIIGGIGALVRWTAMAFDPPVALLPLLQLLHAGSFAATHLGMMGFMARAVPRELAATAQGFVATWSGHRQRLGDLVSGYVYAASGSRAYLVMAAMALAASPARPTPGSGPEGLLNPVAVVALRDTSTSARGRAGTSSSTTARRAR